jgi:hypothetical protein
MPAPFEELVRTAPIIRFEAFFGRAIQMWAPGTDIASSRFGTLTRSVDVSRVGRKGAVPLLRSPNRADAIHLFVMQEGGVNRFGAPVWDADADAASGIPCRSHISARTRPRRGHASHGGPDGQNEIRTTQQTAARPNLRLARMRSQELREPFSGRR